MADKFGGAFGGYTDVTQVISAAAKAQVKANVDKLKALFKDPADEADISKVRYPTPSAKPDFERIHPALARQLHVEIDALNAANEAAPES